MDGMEIEEQAAHKVNISNEKANLVLINQPNQFCGR